MAFFATSSTTQSHNGAGHRTLAASPAGTYTYAYSARRQQTVVIEPGGKTATSSYDPALRRTGLASYSGGRFTYGWDPAGRQISITNPQSHTATMAYDAVGRVLQRHYANGALTVQAFDAAGNLLSILNVCPAGTTVSSLTYGYDKESHRTMQLEADGTLTTWTYDATYQLTREQRSAGPEAIAFDVTHVYDPAGNRISQVESGVVTTFTYTAANRLTARISVADGTTTYSHDGAGNRTLVQTPVNNTYYAWDAAGRMVSTEPTAGTVSFTYNADRQRIGKETPDGSVTGFLYDFKNLLQETDGMGGDVDATYTSTTDEEFGDLLSQDAGAGEMYHQYDAQWNTNALLDDSCDPLGQYKYRAFGLASSAAGMGWSGLTADGWSAMSVDDWSTLPVTGAGLSAQLSFGQKQSYLDPETELLLMGGGTDGRYYDPATGQFISEDPIRQASGDDNLYRYVGNNPVNRIDPSGKDDWDSRKTLMEPSHLTWVFNKEDSSISSDFNEYKSRMKTARLDNQRAEEDPQGEFDRRKEFVAGLILSRLSRQSKIRELADKLRNGEATVEDKERLRTLVVVEYRDSKFVEKWRDRLAKVGPGELLYDERAIVAASSLTEPASGLSPLANAMYNLTLESRANQGLGPPDQDEKHWLVGMTVRKYGTPAEIAAQAKEPLEKIKRMSTQERLLEVLQKLAGSPKLGDELKKRVRELIEPTNMVIFAGLVAGQMTPVGWIADIILAVMFVGAVKDAYEDVSDAISLALGAESEDDFDRAADKLASALSKIAVAIGFYVGAKLAAKGIKSVRSVLKEREAAAKKAEAEVTRGIDPLVKPSIEIRSDAGKVIGRLSPGESLEIISKDSKLYGGNVIQLKPNVTTTVTGTLGDVNVVAIRGLRHSGLTVMGENPGGINILRSPQWKVIQAKYIAKLRTGDTTGYWKAVTDEFWETVNKPWLDEAIARGDVFRFISNPADELATNVTQSTKDGVQLMLDKGKPIRSIFGREVEYLSSKGYEFMSDGTVVKR